MRIQLGAEDRARYGIPEWIELDPTKLIVDEAEAFERVYGIAPTSWLMGLRDDGSGKPQPTLNGNGDPVPVSTLVRCRTWMAVRRAGSRVPLDEFTFNLLECRSDLPEPPDEDKRQDEREDKSEGEVESGKARSPRRSPRTRSPSRSSGDG
jgi:hypothetical protein